MRGALHRGRRLRLGEVQAEREGRKHKELAHETAVRFGECFAGCNQSTRLHPVHCAAHVCMRKLHACTAADPCIWCLVVVICTANGALRMDLSLQQERDVHWVHAHLASLCWAAVGPTRLPTQHLSFGSSASEKKARTLLMVDEVRGTKHREGPEFAPQDLGCELVKSKLCALLNLTRMVEFNKTAM